MISTGLTSSGLDATPQHSTQFPLAWHEKECGFNVRFRVPTKGPKNVIDISLRDQTGETTGFRLDDRMLVEDIQIAYCERKGCSLECMRFMLDGEELCGASSLREHDLESGDGFDAFLSQRGGMYHLSSGRNGFQKLGQPNSMSVNIKYGPDESDIFTMEVSGDDTKESLLRQIRERIDAIRNLQHQIETLKRGGDPTDESTRPKKQHRTGHEPLVAVKKEETSVYDLETDGSSNEQEGDIGE